MSDAAPETNDQLILIAGRSTTGKSASLRNIQDQPNWAYLNTEAGKRLPFQNKFNSFRVSDPYQIWEGFDHFTADPKSKGIIVDSLTFMMDMMESLYIRNSANTQKGWGDFQDFFKVLMQSKVVNYQRPVIFTAHVRDVLDEKAMEMKTTVPIKGALANNGIESYFSTIVGTERMTLKDLEPYQSELLNITEEEQILGYKHVFQTRLTKTSTGKNIRSPMGLFSREQTFIDNDAQMLLDHLHKFYA